MISPRFALPVVLMLALALVPTIIHSYIGLLEDDGKTVAEIPETLGDFTSEPTNRATHWVKEIFDAEDWSERIYKDPDGNQVRLFIARSYDHKKLYHHPELALSYGLRLGTAQRITLSGDHEIPVHLLKDEAGADAAVYVLLYDGGFVENPVHHQILDAFNLLVNGRKKMSLFYAAVETPSGEGFLDSTARSVLIQAIEEFMAQEPKQYQRH